MMRRRGTPGRFGRAAVLEPYRHLAVRVIAQAWRDLFESKAGSDHESARAFLCGSAMLAHWCELAELDPRAVRARVNRFIARRPRASVAEKG